MALLKASIAWAAAHGFSDMTVTTQGENEAALALYEKAGFTREQVAPVLHFWRAAPRG